MRLAESRNLPAHTTGTKNKQSSKAKRAALGSALLAALGLGTAVGADDDQD
jgi:hypothetical protein